MSDEFKGYFLKRPLDFFLALLGLVVSSPLWLLIIFFIYLEDGRPIFYVQDRVGLSGSIFRALKFRTMGYSKSAGLLPKLLRTSAFDELPQLLNILKGEMSFVGPRPLIPAELAYDDIAKKRSMVKPGLTGVSQVYLSKNASILEKTECDLWYGRNQSFLFDIRIILQSFWISFRRKWDDIAKSPQTQGRFSTRSKGVPLGGQF